MKRYDKRIWALCCAMVFVAMFVFFAVIHPLVLFDTDDWSNISYARHALPLWGEWNPTKVFPEVFMPLCGSVAAYVVYPLTGNYMGSLTIVFAAVVALFIAVYAYQFGIVLGKRWRQPLHRVVMWTLLFLLLHFLIFRINWGNNISLFYAPSATCYFHYLIPDLLACSLVLYFMRNDALDNGWEKLRSGVYSRHPVRYGCLLLAVYMALFSNLFSSVILAAYVGYQLIGELAALLARKIKLRDCLRKNGFRLTFIFLWAGVQIFEMNGGRAKSLGGGGFSKGLHNALRACVNMSHSVNGCFRLLAIGFASIALLLLIANAVRGRGKFHRGGETNFSAVLQLLGMGMLIEIYTILVCSVSDSGYLYRGDVLFDAMFCLLFIIILCGVYIVDHAPRAVLLMPLILALVFFEINTMGRTFKDSLMGDIDCGTGLAVGEDIVRQFTEADAKREREIVLYVPHFNSGDNWPVSPFGSNAIARTLYEHGVIDREIAVSEMIPSDEKNRELGIVIPESDG